MTMTEEEIFKNYKAAKRPKEQIKILAEMNCCPQKDIVEILKRRGAITTEPVKPDYDEYAKGRSVLELVSMRRAIDAELLARYKQLKGALTELGIEEETDESNCDD